MQYIDDISDTPARSCDMCYSRKVKCNKQAPSCQHCTRMVVPCTYLRAKRQKYRIGRPPKATRNHNNGVNDNGDLKEDLLIVDKLGCPLTSPSQVGGFRFRNVIPNTSVMLEGNGKSIDGKLTLIKLPHDPSEKARFTYKSSVPLPIKQITDWVTFQISPYRLGRSVVRFSQYGPILYVGNSPAGYALTTNQSLLMRLLHNPADSKKSSSQYPDTSIGYHHKWKEGEVAKDCLMEFKEVKFNPLELIHVTNKIEPQLLGQLVDQFFFHFNSGYSLLNRGHFDDVMMNRTRHSQLLLSAVLMTASGYLPIKSSVTKLGQLYAIHTHSKLKDGYTQSSFEMVLTLMLLSNYPATVMDDTTSQHGWFYHSLAVTMAHQLGLFRICKNIRPDLAELRKRTVWILFGNDVLFRMCVGKPQLIFSSQMSHVALPELTERLDSVEPWHNTSYPKPPSPRRSIRTVELRIKYFKMMDITISYHSSIYSILKPYALSKATIMPLGWNLDQKVKANPHYIKLVNWTADMERKCHQWYLAHHPLRLRRVPKIEQNSIILPHVKDNIACLGTLHYLYLLLTLNRPHHLPNSHITQNQLDELAQLLHCKSPLPISTFTSLHPTSKVIVLSYLAAYTILARKSEFMKLGIPHKWYWLLNFYCGMGYLIEKFDNQKEEKLMDRDGDTIPHVRSTMDELMTLLKEGAQRFVLAADTLSILSRVELALDYY